MTGNMDTQLGLGIRWFQSPLCNYLFVRNTKLEKFSSLRIYVMNIAVNYIYLRDLTIIVTTVWLFSQHNYSAGYIMINEQYMSRSDSITYTFYR